VSAAPGEPVFVLSNGTSTVPDGTFYQLGTFVSAPTLTDLSVNPTLVFSQWQEFTDGVDDLTFSIEAPGGHAAGDLDGADSFAGKSIYWWVFLTSDGLAPATNLSNVTQHALFTGSGGNWVFPEPGGIPPVVSTSDSLTFLAGSYSVGGNVQLAVVPEAGALALSLLGLIPLMRRRR